MNILRDHLVGITAGGSYFLMMISDVQSQITWALGAVGMVFAIGYYAVSIWAAIKRNKK
jgi:hypothetical protein